MPVVTCPHCRTELDLDAADLGFAVECPACQGAFTPPLPVARPVSRQQARSDLEWDDSPEELIRHAKAECTAPGGGLIAIGALSVFFGLGALVFGGVVPLAGGSGGQPMFGLSAEATAIFNLGYGLYMAVAGGFQIYAGRKMQGVQQYALCVIACVMAAIPFLGPCGVGQVFGLIGISKLINQRVKQGFAANRPEFDPDTPA